MLRRHRRLQLAPRVWNPKHSWSCRRKSRSKIHLGHIGISRHGKHSSNTTVHPFSPREISFRCNLSSKGRAQLEQNSSSRGRRPYLRLEEFGGVWSRLLPRCPLRPRLHQWYDHGVTRRRSRTSPTKFINQQQKWVGWNADHLERWGVAHWSGGGSAVQRSAMGGVQSTHLALDPTALHPTTPMQSTPLNSTPPHFAPALHPLHCTPFHRTPPDPTWLHPSPHRSTPFHSTTQHSPHCTPPHCTSHPHNHQDKNKLKAKRALVIIPLKRKKARTDGGKEHQCVCLYLSLFCLSVSLAQHSPTRIHPVTIPCHPNDIDPRSQSL